MVACWKDPTLGTAQVQSTEFSGATVLRVSAYEQFFNFCVCSTSAGSGRVPKSLADSLCHGRTIADPTYLPFVRRRKHPDRLGKRLPPVR